MISPVAIREPLDVSAHLESRHDNGSTLKKGNIYPKFQC
jgi:hypothetical protein